MNEIAETGLMLEERRKARYFRMFLGVIISAEISTVADLLSQNRLLFSRCYNLTAGTFTHEKILLFVGAYRVVTRILSHGFFTSFALCLYQFLKVLLMSLEEPKIVWRLCLTGYYSKSKILTEPMLGWAGSA